MWWSGWRSVNREIEGRSGDPNLDVAVGLIALVCLAIIITLMCLVRSPAARWLRHRHPHVPAAAEDDDMIPMPRGHLDRG